MNVYKVIFANNKILSCKPNNECMGLNGSYQYEHINGNLVYAIINAEDEGTARDMAKLIVKEVKERVYGTAYA